MVDSVGSGWTRGGRRRVLFPPAASKTFPFQLLPPLISSGLELGRKEGCYVTAATLTPAALCA